MMDFANPHFAEPGWLWLAVLVPGALLGLQWHADRVRRRQLQQVASSHALPHLTRSHSPGRRWLKHALQVVALALIGLALARPQWGEIESRAEWLGEDVMIILDCSRSMLATDVQPNRLQRARYAIQNFVQRHGHGRVGLVGFAGSAFLQCPLTFDHEAFLDALRDLDDRAMPVGGTDIGRALEEAVRAMEKKSPRKFMVLITDGEDLQKKALKVAETLAREGVKIYTIGVGTPAGSEIQIMTPQGQMETLRDEQGDIVRSRLDEETLAAVAAATGASYQPLGRLGEGLLKVRQAIQTSDTGAPARTRSRGVDRYYVPLGAALLLVVLESVIGSRRRARRMQGSAAPLDTRAARVGVAAVLLLGFAAPGQTNLATNTVASPAAPPPVTARDLYNVGTQKLAAGKWSEAEAQLQAALARQENAMQPRVLYNLGHVRFAQGGEELKKGGSSVSAANRARRAAATTQAASESAEAALASEDVQNMVAAYQAGRGARREMRAAAQAVVQAMEAHARTLLKWRRSLGDFRSATELNPADTNAVRNAEIVERAIAELIDRLRQMQSMFGNCSQQRQKLNGLMAQLKGKIPKDQMPPGAPGDDEEEDLIEGFSLEELRGMMEAASREGEEMELPLSPDEAGKLLDGFQLDGNRRLPLNQGEPGEPKDRRLRDW